MQLLNLLGSTLVIFALNIGVFGVSLLIPQLQLVEAQPARIASAAIASPQPPQTATGVFYEIQRLPETQLQQPTRTITGTLFAYSSTYDQTNGNPFITASGQTVHDGVIANNCLPLGQEVRINEKDYVVLDRMAARYGCNHFDVWHATRAEAIQFGRQVATVEIY